MVPDRVQDANQVIHNIGLAAWTGGALFGRVALNPALRAIGSHAERGKVANAAWNAYNAVNLLSLAAVVGGHAAGRLSELRDANLGAREKPIMAALDVLAAVAG